MGGNSWCKFSPLLAGKEIFNSLGCRKNGMSGKH